MNHTHNKRVVTASPSTSCDRHPHERFTGFCPSCLFERLSFLNVGSSPSKAAILKPSSSSVSSRKKEARRSCDVKVRNTLWSLFNEDAERIFDVKEGTLRVNCEIDPVFEEGIDCGNYKEPSEEEEEETMELNNTQTTKKLNRDLKDIAGSLWSAASKKLQKWRQKQKKHRSGAALPVEKSIGRQLRDTQSEIAEYRRSCDTDPRFSIDAGRFSLDAARVSVDEPRASWDGYMNGRTAAPPRMSSMLSVVEDSPVSSHVYRSDTHIPVEEPPPPMEEIVPGGSEQTREYYNDSSSRRRKSLDRSSSTRKMSASVMSEINELNLSASRTKTSSCQDRNATVSHSNSLRDDCSAENFDIGECSKKGTRKSKRWSWNIFGLLHRKNGNRYKEEEEEEEGRSGVTTRDEFVPKMIRSNSSVTWRSSATGGGGGLQRNSVDGYVSGKKKKVNSSISTNGRNVDNGTFKFNLTSQGRRRGGSCDLTGQTNRPVPPSHPLSKSLINFY